MEDNAKLVASLLEKATDYGKTTFELSKLKLLETTTIVVPSLASKLIVTIMFTLFTLILNIGIALFLGELLGKSYYGFFIVAGFYLIMGIITFFFLHKWIKKPLSELIIKQALH